MVRFFAISIFLLPIVTASGDDFWDDVDMIYHDLSDPEDIDLPSHATNNDIPDPVDLPTPEMLQHSPSSNKNEKKPSKRSISLTGKFAQKIVTLRASEVERFKQKLITVDSQNISLTIMEGKLMALEDVNKWDDIHTYEVHKYPKYWAKVCVTFWNKPLHRRDRIACVVSRRYSNYTRRMLIIGQRKQYFDLLSCKCHTYVLNCKIPECTPQSFLIHKSNKNEFFIFEGNRSDGKLLMKGFKDGITLPSPSDSELSKKSTAKFIAKSATLRPKEIAEFNRAIHTDISYPPNVSLDDLNDKLMKLEEIHEWPDLLKYDYECYSKYWAKVCVLFWVKELDNLHHQACLVSHSLGDSKICKLFTQNRIQHFDLLWCKCHSYVTNFRVPVSSVDTFLIHQSSTNEFFVFEERATQNCNHTLFIKDFKGGITLPNPDAFN